MSRRTFLALVVFGLVFRLMVQGAVAPSSGSQSLAQASSSGSATGPQIAQAPPRSSGPSADTLIARPRDDGVLEGFRRVYRQEGAPRLVICVDRARVEPGDGAKEQDAAPGRVETSTVAEIERMFGRAFRSAGARIVDQKAVPARVATEPGVRLLDDAAATDRQALAAVADIAIEVRVLRRHLTVMEAAGPVTYPVPDIQATAIRLSDAAIVGRAGAGEVLRQGVKDGRSIRAFDLRDMAAATAIALMEDMLVARP